MLTILAHDDKHLTEHLSNHSTTATKYNNPNIQNEIVILGATISKIVKESNSVESFF